jgi:dienelactone hydrolase
MEGFAAMQEPGYDPVKTPLTTAQAQGYAHILGAFKLYHGCLREKGHWRRLMALNLELAKKHAAVHPDFAAAIGYCLGGQCVLDMLRMGADL